MLQFSETAQERGFCLSFKRSQEASIYTNSWCLVSALLRIWICFSCAYCHLPFRWILPHSSRLTWNGCLQPRSNKQQNQPWHWPAPEQVGEHIHGTIPKRDFTSLALAPGAFQAGTTSQMQTQKWWNDLELFPLLWNKQNWGKNSKIL